MMAIKPTRISAYLQEETSILPLVVFRVSFGLLMLISTVRFVMNGWVSEFYIAPTFHFTYFGFNWVKPLPALGMYAVFILLMVLALCIIVGLFYRVSMAAFFLLFTYVELIDQAYYLNHYYFVSLLSFLLIFLPLHQAASLDSWRRPSLRRRTVPRWTVSSIRLQLGIVYVFAGIAKLNGDWLLRAMPLAIWLPANSGLPLIGGFFDQSWVAYLMSWAGAAYDLSIPFFLLWRRTRPLAFVAVVMFHIMTALLFNIGMFPWIMILASLIFLEERDYGFLGRWFTKADQAPIGSAPSRSSRLVWRVLIPFFVLQLLMPVRYLLYPGNVLWTEEGFRFSWRVMLVEKAGAITLFVHDPQSDRRWTVTPRTYLTRQQEQQMSFQPDMILQFAHFIETQYQTQGYDDVEVRAEAYVSFNGRASQLLIDPTIDLSAQSASPLHKNWILPLVDTR